MDTPRLTHVRVNANNVDRWWLALFGTPAVRHQDVHHQAVALTSQWPRAARR
jgi:hypothetical protein